MVEESQSFGVLGENGRGAVEHWGLKPAQVSADGWVFTCVRRVEGGCAQCTVYNLYAVL